MFSLERTCVSGRNVQKSRQKRALICVSAAQTGTRNEDLLIDKCMPEGDYPFFRNQPAAAYCHVTTYLHVLHKQIGAQTSR